MCEYRIDVWLLQTGQRALQSFNDMFLREAPGVGFLAAGAEEDFCNQNVFVAGPSEFFECGSHLEFTLTVGIDLCFPISLRSMDTLAT